MKKPSRFLRLIGVAGLLATLLAGVFATPMAYAGEPDPDPADDGAIGDIWDNTIEPGLNEGPGSIFFPWVGNDDESTGLGPADTSVSVMNISPDPAVAFAFVGSHDTEELPDTGTWDLVGPFFLAPWASKTFTAAELGIAEGSGAPVAFSGYNQLTSECLVEDDINGDGDCDDVEVEVTLFDGEAAETTVCVVSDDGDLSAYYDDFLDEFVEPDEVGDNDGVNEVDDLETAWGVAFARFGGLDNDGICNDEETSVDEVIVPTVLGGVAKQAVDGETLPFTTAADSSVSGYNSISGVELVEFDDWYFPIAQTNCGPGGCWNTILRIANFGQEVDGVIGQVGSAAVTARFFPSDDAQGSLDTGFQLQALVNTGDVWNIDISDYVPEGWVGSVHVYSDSAVFAMADRVKVGYGAWITNTASNAPHTAFFNSPGGLGQYVLFAPDVRLDFFGWNTGINVANLVNEDNNVNIQYFNLYGNAPSTLTRRLAPQGMTYFYDPSQAPQDNSNQDPTQDVNSDIIGSALIWSDEPVAVAVDATKYPESTTSEDPNIFQAMSYSATGNVYTTQVHPLVQKGNPTDGTGATSGINIMNPNATAAQATVWWVNPSGFGADNFGQSAVAIPGFANGFVYTLAAGNLPNGFYGSAVVNSTLPVASVTTQVDYQVEWDGTAVWLGYNPCGFYRDNGGEDPEAELAGGVTDGLPYDVNCNFGDPFNTAGGQVTKIVHDELGNPIPGVLFSLVNEAYYQQVILGNESYAGVPWEASGYSNVDGEVEWTNVPVGTYRLIVDEVPTTDDNDFGDEELPQYLADEDYNLIEPEEDVFYIVSDQFTINEGEDVVLENVFDRILASKEVFLGDDAEDVPVCLVEAEDEDDEFDSLEDTEAYACDYVDGDGYADFSEIEPGYYFVTVNIFFANADSDPVAGFTPDWFGPEEFELGGAYLNDYAEDVNPEEGHIQKVITLPDFLMALGPDFVDIEGFITIVGPDGEDEVEGNVQEFFLDPIGPNDELSFAITDFNVPVGGPYTIEETIIITYDPDGPGPGGDVVVTYSTILTEAVDGQVICDDPIQPTSTCEASPTDPEIFVFTDEVTGEPLVTRVFNDLSDIVEGQMDVFIRDEVTDDPVEDGLVCVLDVDGEPYTGDFLTSCDLTDADGQAEFLNVPAGTYTITVAAANYEVESIVAPYFPVLDALFGNSGGPFDDELGDELFGLNLDFEIALDPQATRFDVQANVGDPAEPDDGVDGVTVILWFADPFDVPGTSPVGGCVSPLGAQAIQITSTQAVGDDADDGDGANGSIGPTEPGIAEFSLDPAESYCIVLDPNGDGQLQTITGIQADVFPQSNLGPNPPGGNNDFDAFDRGDDIDLVVSEGALGVIDAQLLFDADGAGAGAPAPVDGVIVSFFIADPVLDVPGAGGTCAGAFVGFDVTAPEIVNPGGVLTSGIASLSVDSSLVYCASVAPGASGAGSVGWATSPIVIDDMDQDDDIDATLDDTI